MSDLFLKHQAMIVAMASQFFSVPADADDAVQEVWLKLSAVTTLPDVENEAGFVRVMVGNCFKDIYRKDRRMRELDQEAAIFDDVDVNDPQALALMMEEDGDWARTLEDMPEDLASTARMYYTGGMSYKDIAYQLDIPEGTVASRLNKARQYFQGYRV